MRRGLLGVVAIGLGGLAAQPVAAAPVRALALGIATQRTLDGGAVAAADVASSPAGDLAILWSTRGATRIATRAAGGPFRGPVVLPGAFAASLDDNLTLAGPIVGIGGGTLVSWHAGNRPPAYGLLQVAVADPGEGIALRAPLATLPAIGESARDGARSAVGPDGTATMAVARGGAVFVTQRPPGGSFRPELAVSAPGEEPDYASVRMTQDDTGGVTVTWSSTLPCTTVAAPSCEVNRVAARPAGGAFGAPRSLAELSTGPSGIRGRDPKQMREPEIVADGAGRSVLAWQRTDPGRFDAMEVAVGSAARGYGRPIVLPGTASSVAVPGARCTATTGSDASGRNELFGALPASGGREVVLVKRVSGCGSDVEAFTIAADNSVGAGRVVVSGIGLRAPSLLRRGRDAALVVQSRNAIRAGFVLDGSLERLRRVGPSVVGRFGPSALMRDGSLVVEYGRRCAGGADSTVTVVARSRSRAQVSRRVGACGTPEPTVLDGRGALVTVTLRSSMVGSVSCPIPATLAAQRLHRRPRCR